MAHDGEKDRYLHFILTHFDVDRDGHWNYEEASRARQRLTNESMGVDEFDAICEQIGADKKKGWSRKDLETLYESDIGALMEDCKNLQRDGDRNSAHASVASDTRSDQHTDMSRPPPRVDVPPPPPRSRADEFAETLQHALTLAKPDTNSVFSVLMQCDKTLWPALRAAFTRHVSNHGGDLVAALQGCLAPLDYSHAVDVLLRRDIRIPSPALGVPSVPAAGGDGRSVTISRDARDRAARGAGWDAPYMQTPQHATTPPRQPLPLKVEPPPPTRRSEVIADILHKAVDGERVQLDAVHHAVRQVFGADEWHEIAADFARRHPTTAGGVLASALRGALAPADMRTVEETLRAKGVPPLNPMLPSPRGSNGVGVPSTTPVQYVASNDVLVSQLLEHLCLPPYNNRHRDDRSEDGAVSVLMQIGSLVDWSDMLNIFRKKAPLVHDGDLVQALQRELSPNTLLLVSNALSKHGIELFQRYPPYSYDARGHTNRMLTPEKTRNHDTIDAQYLSARPSDLSRTKTDTPPRTTPGASIMKQVQFSPTATPAHRNNPSPRDPLMRSWAVPADSPQPSNTHLRGYESTVDPSGTRYLSTVRQVPQTQVRTSGDMMDSLFASSAEVSSDDVRLPFDVEAVLSFLEYKAQVDFSDRSLEDIQRSIRNHAEERQRLNTTHDTYALVADALRSALRYRIAEAMERIKLEERGYELSMGRHINCLSAAQDALTNVKPNVTTYSRSLPPRKGIEGADTALARAGGLLTSPGVAHSPTVPAQPVIDVHIVGKFLDELLQQDFSRYSVGELRTLLDVHKQDLKKLEDLLVRHDEVGAHLKDTLRFKLAEESEKLSFDRRGREISRTQQLSMLKSLQDELNMLAHASPPKPAALRSLSPGNGNITCGASVVVKADVGHLKTLSELAGCEYRPDAVGQRGIVVGVAPTHGLATVKIESLHAILNLPVSALRACGSPSIVAPRIRAYVPNE